MIKPLLISGDELRTFEALKGPCEQVGAMVAPKVRLGSILELSNSGLSAEEFAYGTKAEFDFVVTSGNSPRLNPAFAVEFDGPYHLYDDDTKRRDRLKNKICRSLGLPLLRIDAGYLDYKAGKPLVTLLANIFFMEQAFVEAQEAGEIPPWEPFCYWSIYEESNEGWTAPFAIDATARQRMFDYATPRNRMWVPELITTPFGDEHLEVRSYCVFEVNVDEFIVGHAALKNFGFFGGVGAWELATDLAVVNCGNHLELYESGRYRPGSPALLKGIRERTSGWLRQGALLPDLPR